MSTVPLRYDQQQHLQEEDDDGGPETDASGMEEQQQPLLRNSLGLNGTHRLPAAKAPLHVADAAGGGATAAANASLERREGDPDDDDDEIMWQMSGWPGRQGEEEQQQPHQRHQQGARQKPRQQRGGGVGASSRSEDDPSSSPDDASRSTTPPEKVYLGSTATEAAAAESKRLLHSQPQLSSQQQQQQRRPKEPIFTASGFGTPHPPTSSQTPAATQKQKQQQQPQQFQQLGTVGTFSNSFTGRTLTLLSRRLIPPRTRPTHSGSALAGFLSLLLVTCANYVLSPMRDAAALAVGVTHIPALTLASTVLALASSVPVGWLFEAPNPARRGRLWNRVGLTRGETQGTSLALFYRCFAMSLLAYAIGFKVVEIIGANEGGGGGDVSGGEGSGGGEAEQCLAGNGADSTMGECPAATLSLAPFLSVRALVSLLRGALTRIVQSRFGKLFYVAFFLVVHLMKLHSLSLIWGVTSEAMEYEEQAERRERQKIEEEAEATAAASGNSSSGQLLQQKQGGHQRRRNSAPYGPVHGHKHRPVLTSIPSGEVAPPASVTDESGEAKRGRFQRQQQQRQQQGGAEGSGMNDTSSTTTTQSSTPPSSSTASSAPASAPTGSRSRARLKRLSFVGFGGTLGGILGSVIASALARTLHLSGLLVLAALLLELSAELSIELGKIMLRHWQEEQLWAVRIRSCGDLVGLGGSDQRRRSLSSLAEERPSGDDEVDSSMKRVASLGSMKRVASGNSLSDIRRAQSAASLGSLAGGTSLKRSTKSTGSLSETAAAEAKRAAAAAAATTGGEKGKASQQQRTQEQPVPAVDDNSFSQRLLRGVTTILRSRLLMCIFTYNALAATTSVLLSFQRAELVANRSVGGTSAERDTAFLANVNMASSVAVFALQASGAGAFVASSCGQYGTLVLMPMIRLCGVLMLAWWHVKGAGQPPNLTLFLVLDEFTKVINFAVAKPVRESLWRGLSAEARYEAKPIVDTLANRWGGGSAAFLTSAIGKIMDSTSLGHVSEDGAKTLLGFPPILILCTIAAVWWAVVSADLGSIRRRIDIELKKQL